MRAIHEVEINNLIAKAKDAVERAYAPYSGYGVGVCLKGASGAYYLGANIENISYSAVICAERVALSRAVYEGEREFDAMALMGNGEELCVPCGVCLQALSEFCDADMPVICANAAGKYDIKAFAELLPHPFRRM